MRDTDLLLVLVAAAPEPSTLLTQAHPSFGSVFAALYGAEDDPGGALDRDVRVLVRCGDVRVYTIDGDQNARAILVTTLGRDRAARASEALADTGPTPLAGA